MVIIKKLISGVTNKTRSVTNVRHEEDDGRGEKTVDPEGRELKQGEMSGFATSYRRSVSITAINAITLFNP